MGLTLTFASTKKIKYVFLLPPKLFYLASKLKKLRKFKKYSFYPEPFCEDNYAYYYNGHGKLHILLINEQP